MSNKGRVIRIFVNSDPALSSELRNYQHLFGAAEFYCGLTAKGCDADFLKKTEVLAISPFTGGGNPSHVLACVSALPNLRWVHSLSAGVDSFLTAIRSSEITKDLPLTNARGAFSSSLAEYCLGAALHFNKQIPRLETNRNAKVWDKFQMNEMLGKTLGFVGFGSIAKQTLALFYPLGFDRILVNRRGPPSEDDLKNYPFVEWHEEKDPIFEHSDFLICSLPGTPETFHYCDELSFSAMKQGAVFISIGRGSVVDEEGLLKHAGKLGGIAMDVFEKEPLSPDSKLWDLDNILISPHNADLTPGYFKCTMEVFAQRFNEYVANRPFEQVVDTRVGY